MVRGLDTFRTWFKDYSDNYIIIGGTACDAALSDAGLTARATKDGIVTMQKRLVTVTTRRAKDLS